MFFLPFRALPNPISKSHLSCATCEMRSSNDASLTTPRRRVCKDLFLNTSRRDETVA